MTLLTVLKGTGHTSAQSARKRSPGPTTWLFTCGSTPRHRNSTCAATALWCSPPQPACGSTSTTATASRRRPGKSSSARSVERCSRRPPAWPSTWASTATASRSSARTAKPRSPPRATWQCTWRSTGGRSRFAAPSVKPRSRALLTSGRTRASTQPWSPMCAKSAAQRSAGRETSSLTWGLTPVSSFHLSCRIFLCELYNGVDLCHLPFHRRETISVMFIGCKIWHFKSAYTFLMYSFYINSLSVFFFASFFFYLSSYTWQTLSVESACISLFLVFHRIGEYISLDLFKIFLCEVFLPPPPPPPTHTSSFCELYNGVDLCCLPSHRREAVSVWSFGW